MKTGEACDVWFYVYVAENIWFQYNVCRAVRFWGDQDCALERIRLWGIRSALLRGGESWAKEKLNHDKIACVLDLSAAEVGVVIILPYGREGGRGDGQSSMMPRQLFYRGGALVEGLFGTVEIVPFFVLCLWVVCVRS